MKVMKAILSTSLILLCLTLSHTADARRDGISNEEEIKALIVKYVAKQLSSGTEEIHVSRIVSTNGGSLRLPGKVKGVRAGSQGRLLGRILFALSIEGNAPESITRWVTADVKRIHKIVVASRSLKRHHVLGKDDLAIRTISVTHQRNHFFTHPETLIGKRLTRSTGKGVPIRSDLVEEAPLILRGDRVMLLLEAKGLRIMTLGRAKEDGFLGKIVGIQNLDSKKIVYGKVIEPGVVKVSFKAVR